MTKKHFEKIAEILSNHTTSGKDETEAEVAQSIALELADYFSTVHSQFNRYKFLKKCEVEDD